MNDELKNAIREDLAAYAHEAWSSWMKYMFDTGGGIYRAPDTLRYVWAMFPELYDRWQRQMNTSYADLPESEKASDRAEADKMLAILEEYE